VERQLNRLRPLDLVPLDTICLRDCRHEWRIDPCIAEVDCPASPREFHAGRFAQFGNGRKGRSSRKFWPADERPRGINITQAQPLLPSAHGTAQIAYLLGKSDGVFEERHGYWGVALRAAGPPSVRWVQRRVRLAFATLLDRR
jgi:hypothetical protein